MGASDGERIPDQSRPPAVIWHKFKAWKGLEKICEVQNCLQGTCCHSAVGGEQLARLALALLYFWSHRCACTMDQNAASRSGPPTHAGSRFCLSCLQVTLISQGRGEEIVLETRLYDEAKQVTRSMRKKEGLADYRYFPEPDLPPLGFTQESVDELQVSGLHTEPQPMQLSFWQAGGHGSASCWVLAVLHSATSFGQCIVETAPFEP